MSTEKKSFTPDQINAIKYLSKKRGITLRMCISILEEVNWNSEDPRIDQILEEKYGEELKKFSQREAKEGLIAVKKIDNELRYIVIRAETDFALATEDMKTFISSSLDSNKLMEDKLSLLSGKLGEKIEVEGPNSFSGHNIYYYLHSSSNKYSSNTGSSLFAVDIDKDLPEVGKNVVMAICMNSIKKDEDIKDAVINNMDNKKLEEYLQENNCKLLKFLNYSIR